MAEAKIVNVTPAQAKKWLATNKHNRTLRQVRLAHWKGVIERGEWVLTNDALCFDTDGELINGQHRLTAVIETDKTLPFLVLEGVPRRNQLAMDTGARRTAHEQMQVMGIQSSPMKAALCRALLTYDDNKGPTKRVEGVTNLEIIELAEGDKTLDEAISLTMSLGRHIDGARLTSIALGYYLLLCAWPDKVEEFHEKLCYGIDLTMNSPIRRLRSVLTSRAIKQGTDAERRKLLGMFLKAFNLWIDGREIETFTFRHDEDWPRPYTPTAYQKLLASRERARRGFETRKSREAS